MKRPNELEIYVRGKDDLWVPFWQLVIILTIGSINRGISLRIMKWNLPEFVSYEMRQLNLTL